MRIWKSPEIEIAQQKLINIFTDKILNRETFHLNLFFDENWNCKSTAISYGHDIEASWLLFEAAEVLGNAELIDKIKNLSLKIADAASKGLQPDGSMIYEKVDGSDDMERHWWVQAEAVVGLMFAWKNSGNALYLENAKKTWNYIRRQIIDPVNGEWYWSRLPNGQINLKDDKAGFWKCPYHNGRMCLEMVNG